jgi:hypothetical protein
MKAMSPELVLVREAKRPLILIDMTKISSKLFYLKFRIIQNAKGLCRHTKRIGREANRKTLSRRSISLPLVPVIGMPPIAVQSPPPLFTFEDAIDVARPRGGTPCHELPSQGLAR